MKQFLSIKSYQQLAIVLLIIILGLLYHFGISLRYGTPEPIIHDEFAYLLASDTFAHGRLTNPVHPFWEHFQTFHVFVQPSYQAKYPPGQGIFLAIGQVLFGAPIWGIWISLALAYGATYWLLTSVFKPSYAFLGTLLVLLNPYIGVTWGLSYWGGGVAMLGGALLFGGISHSRKNISLITSLLLCSGIIILANSRPFEGFILCMFTIPMIAKIGISGYTRQGKTITLTKFVIPLGITCILLIIWILYYNEALSGDPLKYYYLNWDHRSSTIELINSYKGSLPLSPEGKLFRLWAFFIGPYLSFSAAGILFVVWRKEMIFEMACILGLVVVSIIFSRAWPHYLAPVASLTYLLIFRGIYEIRHVRFIKSKRIKDLCIVLIVGIYLVVASLEAIEAEAKLQSRFLKSTIAYRKPIVEKLEMDDVKDLVLVHYGKNHNIHMEWVYNAADIDNAEIIWAHSLGTRKDRRLINYYKDRNIWLLYPDNNPIMLRKVRDAGANMNWKD